MAKDNNPALSYNICEGREGQKSNQIYYNRCGNTNKRGFMQLYLHKSAFTYLIYLLRKI